MTQIDSTSLGWVYVLSNPSMPGQLKVGFTDRTVTERIGELSAGTGVPVPFVWEYGVKISGARLVERAAHQELSECRLSSGREFFGCEIARAIQAILVALDKIEPLEVFDRQRMMQAAAEMQQQEQLAEKWRDGYLSRLRVMREELEREVGDSSLGAPFLGYALGSFLLLDFALGRKSELGLLLLSVIAGGILALIHQSKRLDARKESIKYQSRLEAIELCQRAVRESFERALTMVRQGKAFAEIEPTLAHMPGESPQASGGSASAGAEPARQATSQQTSVPRQPVEKTSKSTAAGGQPTTATYRSFESASPRFFGCDKCKKTVSLDGTLTCRRFSCPARQIKAEPISRSSTPLELASWPGAGPSVDRAADAREAAAARRASAAGAQRPAAAKEPTTEHRFCVYCRSEVAARVGARGDVVCLRCRNAL